MAFKVTLNGSNYVSQERVRAFEEAVRRPSSLGSVEVALGSGRGAESPSGNGGMKAPASASAGEVEGTTPVAPAEVVAVDYLDVLESLERGLARSYDHQSETLQVHQHYLANEASYASIFAELMEAQAALFSEGSATPERAKETAAVLHSLATSLERFHQHQAETLDVHSRFLEQQAAYAEAFVELLRSHYGNLLEGKPVLRGNGRERRNGNGNEYHGNGHTRQQATSLHSGGRRDQPAVSAPLASPGVRSESPPIEASAAAPMRPLQATDDSEVVAASSHSTLAEVDAEELAATLLSIVSEKTGYPAEMLELDMDMEADLGIDSIKRVEILGALQDTYPDLPEVEMETLGELRTLGQILDSMQEGVRVKKA